MECKSAQPSRTKCPVRHLHARLRQKCLVKSVRVLFGFFFLAAQILASATGCQFYPLGEYMRFIRIPEDLRIGDIVLNLEIHARQGHNLSLESVDRNTDDAKYFRLVEVDDQRVEIRVGRSLENLVDAETPQSILKFRVVCAPAGAEGSPVVQSVTIYLEDVNNHAPQFVGAPYNVTVDELTPVGLTLFRGIAALDHDKPNTVNSDVYFSIVGGNEGGHFGLAPGTGAPAALTLRKRLDYDGGDQEFKLVLQATDRGREPLSSTATLYVTVLDSDDLHPIFSSSVYSTTVTEAYPWSNATIRQRVEFPSGGGRGGAGGGPIRAYDQDASINATIEYDIVSGNELAHFEIGVTTGELYLVRQIDRETLPPTMGSAFELQIRARQSDNPTKFGLARVHVDVLDINDNLPRFEAEVYNISIMENLPNHFSIVQVYATDADVGENAEFGYKLEDASRAFAINYKTGWLTVRDQSKLDRERVDSFSLTVYAEEKVPNVASSGAGPSKRASCTISIILLDSNDNSPKFEPSNLYKFQITSGAAQIGDVIGKITAVDPDLGGNGKVSYEIQKQNASTSAFARAPDEGVDPFQVDEKEGYIYLLEASQTLGKAQYVLLIGAYDQPLNPSERRSSLAVVQIDVVKNHGGVGGAGLIGGSRPEFVGSPYQFWVGNEVGVGTSVGQVKVRDFDPKNTVYDLLHSYYDGVPFAIEERTGIIAVVDDLLKYARHAYDFEAYVTDSRHTLTTNVSIHIVDPISSDSFESNQQNGGPRPPIELSVQENVAGAIIGNLKTILLGGGGSGIREAGGAIVTPAATMELVLANGRDKFGVSPDGTLYTLQGLDREEPGGASYLLTVISQSRGHVGGVHAHQVHITVVDENDNPPQFDRQQYEGAVKENVNPGTPVTMETPIRIIDLDEGANSAYRIELSGNGADRFRIDPSSGRVYVGNKNLDREERQIYHLDLTATDGLNRSARARLQIMVTDLNDNAPQFIHKIIVDPPEVDENGGPSGMRELLQHSGSSQPVSLEIASSEPILVPETIPIGSVIARVSASDRDLDDNARVFYRIVSENSNTTGSAVPYLTDKQYLFSRTKSEKHFGIDRVSGRISVIKGLKPDTSYALNISASDRGGLRSYTGIKINAYDVNNHLPTFREHFYRYELTEGQFLNAQIGRVSATDKDSGLNGEILYTLNWKDPKDKKSAKELLPFSINSTSGVIFAHGDIDREVRSSYHLQALATDGGVPPLSASVDVEIAVLDKNESPPKFYNHVSSVIMNGVTIPVYRAILEDGAPAGSLVTRLYANDTDDPLLGNGVVLFHLTNHHKEFHIDSKNGTIFTSMKLRTSSLPGADGQKKEYNFNLSVVAQDLGRPSLSSKAFVLVRLEPLAGSASSSTPSTSGILGRLFEEDSYSFKIPYQTHGPIPAFLAKINVTAPYRRLKTEFELAGPESVVGNFRVEGGAIYVVKRLAADTSYEFLIRGYNSGTKQKVFDTRQRVRAAVMGKIPESNEAVIRVHVEPASAATPTPPPTISFKKPIANVNVNVKPHSSPSEPPPSVFTPKSSHGRSPTKTKTNTAVLNEFVSSSTNRPRPHPHPVGPSDPNSKPRGKPSSLYAGEVAIIVLSAIILLGGLVAAISVSCVRKKRGHRSRRGGAGGPMPLEVHLQKHGAGARMVSNRPLIFPMALPAHDQIQPPPGSESTSDTYTDPGDMFVDHGHGGHGHGGHAAALGLHASGFSICPECRKLRKPSTATQTIIFDPAPRGHIIDRGPLKQVRSFGRDISLQSNNDSGIDGSDGQCNCYQSHNFSSDSSGRSLFVDQYEDSLMPPMMVAQNPKSFRRKHSSRRPSKHKSNKRSSNTTPPTPTPRPDPAAEEPQPGVKQPAGTVRCSCTIDELCVWGNH